MIFTDEQSISLLLEVLEVIEEPFKSLALAAVHADSEFKKRMLRKKFGEDYDIKLAEAYRRIREELADKGIEKFSDLPL